MVGEDGRVHAKFSPMMRTGRTSCSGPPLQQYPRKQLVGADGKPVGEVRGIYIPSQGYYMLATDYCQLELCALAESCYRRFGRSKMGDLINDGLDTHLWFGNEFGRYKGMVFDPDDKEHPVTADLRQRAKASDFGFPGGLGPATFVAYARNYGVDLTLDEATELREMWFNSFPEMRDHLRHEVDDISTRFEIRKFLADIRKPNDKVTTVRDLEEYLVSCGYTEEFARKSSSHLTRYMMTTLTGRKKRNCAFCAAANLEFQAPAADGAKLALWAGYVLGWRMVNFIHDEILQEVSQALELEERTAFVEEVESTMIREMESVLPRMKIKVESSLSARWLKGAKHKTDDNGNLLVWQAPSQNISEIMKQKVS
jgi:DNA polymerase I-like protein with 3'-5' exonuclease and polymerase domains